MKITLTVTLLFLAMASTTLAANQKCLISAKKEALVASALDLRANEIDIANLKITESIQTIDKEFEETYEVTVSVTKTKSRTYTVENKIFSDDPLATDIFPTCHSDVSFVKEK